MKHENNRCWNCGRYNSYYTLGISGFAKDELGYCETHCNVIERWKSCDNWTDGQSVKKARRVVANAIAEIHNNLAVIEQLLSEESEPRELKDEKET